jgi:hypothetical protein
MGDASVRTSGVQDMSEHSAPISQLLNDSTDSSLVKGKERDATPDPLLKHPNITLVTVHSNNII